MNRFQKRVILQDNDELREKTSYETAYFLLCFFIPPKIFCRLRNDTSRISRVTIVHVNTCHGESLHDERRAERNDACFAFARGFFAEIRTFQDFKGHSEPPLIDNTSTGNACV